MTFFDAVSLFGIMFLLALLPSSSVMLVSVRAATGGFVSGVWAALGIVVGDLVFVIVALLGLFSVTSGVGGLGYLIKYLAGFYLIWLGGNLQGKEIRKQEIDTSVNSKASSFVAGLLLTLVDLKAVFFYLSLFPVFVDLTSVEFIDVAIIVAITVASVGSVKIMYAYLASKANSRTISSSVRYWLTRVSGVLLMCAGVWLLVKP